MEVEGKLEELGLVLPEPLKPPSGLVLPFSRVRVRSDRAYVSGTFPSIPTASSHTLWARWGRGSPRSRPTRRRA